MEEELKEVDAECNVCEWKGFFNEMIEPLTDEEVHKCPECNTENVYYYKQPPHFLNHN